MSEYERINITEATAGDEVLQAGEWVAVDSVHLMQHSDSVKIIWAGGGSHCAPRHHFGAVRRLVDDTAELIAAEERAHAERLASVRELYGEEAADLVEQGWTVDSAIDHVEGACDQYLCTHPAHQADYDAWQRDEAEALARATGSVAATVIHERRLPTGELELVLEATFTRDAAPEVQGYTPTTDDVRTWLDGAFPERDVAVEHTADCDRVSAGDACTGGCKVVTA